jgi:ubiquinone/menaquinone biosynthesis C-methylase UbiE
LTDAYRRINADRIARMRSLVGRLFREPNPRILDVGCGAGYDLSRWLEFGWPADRLAGVDLVESRVQSARLACPGVRIDVNKGTSLPFADDAFDLTTAVTVFSSILDSTVRRSLFEEMARVTAPGGAVLVYDFVIRNPRNPNVLAMTRRRLEELDGRPTGSIRLTPLIYVVAAGAAVHPRVADLAERLAPPTHRLTWWRPAG